MKKLLTLLLFIPILGFAQDSTSFSTQEVNEFVPLSIMDEFEKAYGAEQKTALRVGVTSINNFSFSGISNSAKPFIEFEQKIGKSFSVKTGIVWYNSSSFEDMNQKMVFPSFLDLKYYPMQAQRIKQNKQSNNFLGGYLGVRLFWENPFKSQTEIQTNFFNYQNNFSDSFFNFRRLEIYKGWQFGESFDFRIITGYSKHFKLDNVDQEKLQINYSTYDNFYLKTSSTISFDLLRTNKKNTNTCEILNCDKTLNTAFKFNFIDLMNISSHGYDINVNPSFEKRIAQSRLTVNSTLNVKFSKNSQSFVNFLVEASDTLYFNQNYVPKNATIFNNTLNLFKVKYDVGLRYYLLNKRQKLESVGVKNLTGGYTEIGARVNYYKGFYSSVDSGFSSLFVNPYLTVGSQKIFSNKYFVDVNASLEYFRDKGLANIGNGPLGISFGISAGLIK